MPNKTAASPLFPEERTALIAFLNEVNPPGPLQLRADANDTQIAEARAAAFETLVDNEAYRIASDGGRNPVRSEQLNALRPQVRVRMLARLNPTADGWLAKLRKKLDRKAQLEEEREAIEREEAELVAVSQRFESLQGQRRELVTKVERAKARLATLPERRAALVAEARKLHLDDYDLVHGSDVTAGIFDCYSAIAAVDLALADAKQLDREWSAQLADMDKKINVFQKANDI